MCSQIVVLHALASWSRLEILDHLVESSSCDLAHPGIHTRRGDGLCPTYTYLWGISIGTCDGQSACVGVICIIEDPPQHLDQV